MDDKTMVYSPSSTLAPHAHRPGGFGAGECRCCLLNKLSTLCLLLDQRPFRREFQFHLNLLEATVIADQSFTDDVESTVVFIFQAEVVIQINATLDNLAAAIAFYIKGVVSFFGFGRCAAKEILEEAHKLPFLSCERR